MIKVNSVVILAWLSCLLLLGQSALAQDNTAEYRVTFTGNWTLASTPGGVVSSAHFTTLAGATHSSSATYWAAGSRATSGMESLAELGGTGGFLSEIRNSNQYHETISAPPSFGGTGTASFTVNATKSFPRITLASMIGPSPDWFVGISGVSLLDGQGNWHESLSIDLFPYDAGTENGTEFSLSNPATVPQGVITSIRGKGKFSNVRMGRLSFSRADTPVKPPPPPPNPPSITAIELPSGASQHTNADSVSWMVSFSQSVRNVSADDFRVFGTTATVTSVNQSGGTGSKYQVNVSGGDLPSLNGTISLGLSSQQDITNASNEALSSRLPATQETYNIDNLGPRISSISPQQADSSPFTLTITFDESVTSGALSKANDVTSSNAAFSTPQGNGSTFTVEVTPNNPNVVSTINVSIAAGAAEDFAGNPSQEFQGSIRFEPAAPATFVERVEALTPDGTYHLGERIEIGIYFSDTISVTGNPRLLLDFEMSVRHAEYEGHIDESSLLFGYSVMAGDATSRLSYVGPAALELAGGTIVGSNGDAAYLTLPNVGETGSLYNANAIVTTGRENTFPSFGDAVVPDQVFYQDVPIDPIELPQSMDGDGELTYDLTPMLPAGLALDMSTFRISGAATELGEATSYTWMVTDEDGDSASLPFSITVRERTPLELKASDDIAQITFFQYEAIEAIMLPLATGGVGKLTYSLSPELPAGLTLDTATQVISGVPSIALEETTFTWRVTDEFEGDISLQFTITVIPYMQLVFASDAAVASQILKQDEPIEPFSLPQASGGTGELGYTLSPSLPAGLSLNKETFEISGTPSEPLENTTYSWVASDGIGETVSIEFTLRVVAVERLEFEFQLMPQDFEYIQNSTITSIQLPLARGGFGEYAYELSPALPDGLSLTDAFSIVGTPTLPSPATSFTWRAVDFFADEIALSFTLTVVKDEMPSFAADTSISNMTFIQNSAIDAIVLPRAMGGNGALTHVLDPALPTGLELDLDTFTINGTPTNAVETTAFTWKVTDVDGDESTIGFLLTVDADLQPVFSASDMSFESTFTQNSEIGTIQLPSASSGNGALSYTLSPALPQGLSLNETDKTISGTATEWLSATEFAWEAQDVDGDVVTFTFVLTIVEDLQPAFATGTVVESREFITDSAIDAFSLPVASGGNGELRYVLSPSLPSGLSLDDMTFEIQGTPLQVLPQTRFEWSVADADGDSTAVHFELTVLKDEQPVFNAQIADQVLIVGTAMQPLNLPEAMSGNGELQYELTPMLGNGLSLDPATAVISGTPLSESTQQTYRWIATDLDGDTATLSFGILVQPASPVLAGSISPIQLLVGGASQQIDANPIFVGRIDTWNIEIADVNVATASLLNVPGIFTLTPRFEGATTGTITVSNVTGTVSTSFVVNVQTASIEIAQIESTMSLNASAVLGSVLNIFKKRTETNEHGHGSSSAKTEFTLNPPRWNQNSWSSAAIDQSVHGDMTSLFESTPGPNFAVGQSPMSFSHTATSWSAWGAFDMQTFSSQGDAIDGSMTSMFIGADFSLADHTFAGIAVSNHSGSSNYEFNHSDASGDGSLDINLVGFYPYLQHGDGKRYSTFLVGGRATGDVKIYRNHAFGIDSSGDGEMSVLGAGFDYVLWRLSTLDVSLVGDAGRASFSTSADSGVLADREGSSSKVSFGASLSLSQPMETGSMTLSGEFRGVNENVVESAAGLELGGNLNFVGEHIGLMVDARRVSVDSQIEQVRNSISTRLRYQARTDGSGLIANLTSSWHDHALRSALDLRRPLISGIGESKYPMVGSNFEIAVGYGLLTNREAAVLEPQIKWREYGPSSKELRVGALLRSQRTIRGQALVNFDLIQLRDSSDDGRPLGVEFRMVLPL